MKYAGIDFSTKAVDVVLIDTDGGTPEWRRFVLEGQDAFDRARRVRDAMPSRTSELWDDVLGIGIEDPRGYGSGAIYRVQGAILACLPVRTMVKPWIPSQWRVANGMSGRASKADIRDFVWDAVTTATQRHLLVQPHGWHDVQDVHDAYCIARATMLAARTVEALL